MSAIHDIAQGSHKGASLKANSDSAPTPCAGTGLKSMFISENVAVSAVHAGSQGQRKSERLAIIMNVDVSGKSDTKSDAG